MSSAQDQIDALLKELKAASSRAEKADEQLKAVTKERDDLKRQIDSHKIEAGLRKEAESDASAVIGILIDQVRQLKGVNKLERDYFEDLLQSAFKDKKQYAHWRPIINYFYRKQSEASHRVFDSKDKKKTADGQKVDEKAGEKVAGEKTDEKAGEKAAGEKTDEKAGEKAAGEKTDEKAESADGADGTDVNSAADKKPARRKPLYDIEEQQKRANGTVDSVAEATRAVVENAAGDTPEAVDAMSDIFNSEVPPQAEPTVLPEGAKKTAGRQVPKSKREAQARRAAEAATTTAKGTETEIEISYVCPRCGGTHWVKVDSVEFHLRYFIEIIESSLSSNIFDRHIFECSNCHFKHMHNPEDEPVPVNPMSTLSQDVAISAGVLGVKGVPVNRFEHCVGTEEEQLGSDTLDRNIHRLFDAGGLKGLVECIEAEAKKSEVIIVDETPFICLQQAGMSQVDGEAVRKALGTKAKKGQVVAVSSAPWADLKFHLYYRSNSRSTESIGQCLEGWTPEVIVADGLAVYDKLTNYDSKRRQVCLVHWRRKVLAALDVEELKEVVESADGFVIAQRKILEGDPQFKMCAVVAALQKLYYWEDQLKRLPNESHRAFCRRVKACREKHAVSLMEAVDRLMKDMAEHYVKYDEVKKTYVQIIESPLSEAIVFYMNNRQGLRLFLKDPRLPADSNAVEQAIRPVTVVRNGSHFKQSPDFLESFCGYMTLVETARMNGIKKPMHWLMAVARAYYQHCLDWTLTLKGEAGLKTIKPAAWCPEAMASFDYRPYLPHIWKDAPD